MEVNSDRREYCHVPITYERPLPPGINLHREALIRVLGKTWVNGTQIHYCFFNSNMHGSPSEWNGSDEDQKVVRESFEEWKTIGIGLEFIETQDIYDAEVRIGFQHQAGSWSYVGTDVLDIPQNQRTMNFGWELAGWDYGKTTALHEIGHTLGLPHEHQNPNAGIDWNEENVYEYFSAPPNNWDAQTIEWNVLRKIPIHEVEGSSWDPESIMHYSFEAPLIDAPPPYSEQGVPVNYHLSEKDKQFINQFYPGLSENDHVELVPFHSHPATLMSGEQLDFIIRPARTREYRMQTFGNVDTLLVLFEKQGDRKRFLEADDDAGYGRNAFIKYRLFHDREYVLRLRFYYGNESGETAVMVW